MNYNFTDRVRKVLAMAREGYTKTTINFRDLAESLTYPGFLRLAAKYLPDLWS